MLTTINTPARAHAAGADQPSPRRDPPWAALQHRRNCWCGWLWQGGHQTQCSPGRWSCRSAPAQCATWPAQAANLSLHSMIVSPYSIAPHTHKTCKHATTAGKGGFPCFAWPDCLMACMAARFSTFSCTHLTLGDAAVKRLEGVDEQVLHQQVDLVVDVRPLRPHLRVRKHMTCLTCGHVRHTLL